MSSIGMAVSNTKLAKIWIEKNGEQCIEIAELFDLNLFR